MEQKSDKYQQDVKSNSKGKDLFMHATSVLQNQTRDEYVITLYSSPIVERKSSSQVFLHQPDGCHFHGQRH